MLKRSWRLLKAANKIDLTPHYATVVTPATCLRMGTIFRDLAQEKLSVGEHFRSRAYWKASSIMFKLHGAARSAEREGIVEDPVTVEGLLKIDGMGQGMVERVVEVLNSSDGKSLAEHDQVSQQPLHNAKQIVASIHGFGPRTAALFVKDHTDIQSIDDVRALAVRSPDLFTTSQLLGLRFYDDSALKIPRAEVDLHRAYLLDSVKQIDPALRLELCGSYRRGLLSSGDVDCLLTWGDAATPKQVSQTFLPAADVLKDTDSGPEVVPPGGGAPSPSKGRSSKGKKAAQSSLALAMCPMHELVYKLQKDGYMVGCLACGDTKTMGYCKLPNNSAARVRRLDVRWVSHESFPTALLYFTGSADFNTRMRNLALAKRMTLNEYGLFHLRGPTAVSSKKKGSGVSTGATPRDKGKRVPCATEEDVFKAIGMDFVKPEQRSA